MAVQVPLNSVSSPKSLKLAITEPGRTDSALLIYTGFINDLMLDNTAPAGGFDSGQAISLLSNSDRSVDFWKDNQDRSSVRFAVEASLTVYYNSDGAGSSAQLNSAEVGWQQQEFPNMLGEFNFLTLTLNLQGQHAQVWGVSYQVTVHHHIPGGLKSATTLKVDGSSTADGITLA